ncbi:unnamed protein product [Pedinophyceae sp. YPF-701]|nr:unnamed protein product [Pedinophyceae sp. YPF-701]
MGQPGYLEIFPRAGTKQPRLLQKLEQMLGDKLRAAERLVQGPVFEAFIQAFTTYKPLLSAIKREYDSVLDDSLKSAHENVVMRAELAVAEQRKNRAVEEARAEAAASAASLRAELHARLMEAEERSRKAEAREAKLESEVKRLQSSLAKLQEDLEGAKRANQSLTAQMVAESSWAAKPLAGQIAAVVVGKKSEPEQKGDKAQ